MSEEGIHNIPKKQSRLCGCKSENKKEHNIDVYWFADDGGLTLLLPYLISINYDGKANLRIFTLGTAERLESDKLHFEKLMEKFRIEVAELEVLTRWRSPPSNENTDKVFILPLTLGDYVLTDFF